MLRFNEKITFVGIFENFNRQFTNRKREIWLIFAKGCIFWQCEVPSLKERLRENVSESPISKQIGFFFFRIFNDIFEI